MVVYTNLNGCAVNCRGVFAKDDIASPQEAVFKIGKMYHKIGENYNNPSHFNRDLSLNVVLFLQE